VTTPPIEGELVNPDTFYHDYEGYDTLPGFGDIGDPAKRIIEGEVEQPGQLEQPPWWMGPVVRGIGRAVLGPIGGALPSIIEAGMPEILGSGELPFPPIPQVSIPNPPDPQLQWPDFGDFPTPEVPELARPEVPDVVVVSAPAPQSLPAPRSSQTLPKQFAQNPAFWGLLGGLAPILRPKHRRRARPSPSNLENFLGQEINPLTPLPSSHAIETLPRGATPPATLEDPFDLPGPFGPLQFLTPTETTTDDERCKCKKNEKHEPDPSDVVANVKVYKRRMSTWSLKNLNRGTKAAKLLQRFI
jgi:hypothetical protein